MPKVYTGELIHTKIDTHRNWIQENPILFRGEVGFEEDKLLYKFGDGISNYNQLEYRSSYFNPIKQGIPELGGFKTEDIEYENSCTFSYIQYGNLTNLGFYLTAKINSSETNEADEILINFIGAPKCYMDNILYKDIAILGIDAPDVICAEFIYGTSSIRLLVKHRDAKYDEIINNLKPLHPNMLYDEYTHKDHQLIVRGFLTYIADIQVLPKRLTLLSNYSNSIIHPFKSEYVQYNDGDHETIMFNIEMLFKDRSISAEDLDLNQSITVVNTKDPLSIVTGDGWFYIENSIELKNKLLEYEGSDYVEKVDDSTLLIKFDKSIPLPRNNFTGGMLVAKGFPYEELNLFYLGTDKDQNRVFKLCNRTGTAYTNIRMSDIFLHSFSIRISGIFQYEV